MTIETFLELAEQFDALGGAVQEQLRNVLDDSDTMDEQNPNALRLIRDRLLRDMIELSRDDELADEASDLRNEIDKHLAQRSKA